MKGRKTDSEFISQYISKCIQKGSISTNQIIDSAKKDLQNIDNKILEVELLKKNRPKLLDVIANFEKPIKDVQVDKKVLSFFNLEYPEMCKIICVGLNNGDCQVRGIIKKYNQSDSNYTIKQLIEHKIINKYGDVLVKGDLFDDYMNFLNNI